MGLELGITLALGVVALAVAAAFVRLARGPSLADRIVALDVIAACMVAACLLYAIDTGLATFVDIALAIALVTFLGTVALARTLESGGDPR